ncbi:MAG: alpha/beta hydrolase fold domain-containing protein [Microbacterium sp.]
MPGLPLWLADSIAKLAQKAPAAGRESEETSFAEIPGRTSQVTIPTRHGEVAAQVYHPAEGAARAGVYLNLHGGGFVFRHPEQDDPQCRYIAEHAGITVVNLDYTPAPQLRAPGSVEQAYDAAVWAASPERDWAGGPLVVGGQSAGGALAAGVARLALEQGGPQIALQVLMYPPLDLTVSASAKHIEGTEKFLVRMGPVFDTVYCPDKTARADRLISPAGPADTASLAGIAPALVITTEKDILGPEGRRYADRLERDGALREHLDVPGVGHGFNILGSPRDVVAAAYDRIVARVREVAD